MIKSYEHISKILLVKSEEAEFQCLSNSMKGAFGVTVKNNLNN